eukprot:3654553-Lingulodinium_polyedra.AAC.1
MARARASPSVGRPSLSVGSVWTTRACGPGPRLCPASFVPASLAARCRSWAADVSELGGKSVPSPR